MVPVEFRCIAFRSDNDLLTQLVGAVQLRESSLIELFETVTEDFTETGQPDLILLEQGLLVFHIYTTSSGSTGLGRVKRIS